MSIFLAVTPQSVCNGAVKIEPLKQLEVDLLNAVNDSGYLSYGSAPKIGHSPLFLFFFFFFFLCWLVSTQQLQPKSHLGPKQRETLKYSLYVIWMSLRTVSEPCKCVSGRKYKENWRECHIMSVVRARSTPRFPSLSVTSASGVTRCRSSSRNPGFKSSFLLGQK